MLISALCDYYKILEKSGKALPEGYSSIGINYLIGLNPDGKIGEIIEICVEEKIVDKKGKVTIKKHPKFLTLPKRTEKSAIDANIPEHRPLYIFGLNFENGLLTPLDDKNKAKKSNEAFKSKNLDFIDGLDSEMVSAYSNFINNWNPEEETENEHILSLGKSYSTANYAFCLSGKPHILLHEDEVFNAAYLSSISSENSVDELEDFCGILGEKGTIARVHSKIKGVAGGLSSGTVLIGANSKSEESYGKEQSYNSNVSKKAMQIYTETLNNLISDRNHKTLLDDITVVHFAMNENDIYDKIVKTSVFEDISFDDEQVILDDDDDAKLNAGETQKLIKEIIIDAIDGAVHNNQMEIADEIDENVDFYMLGIKPNMSRLAVKFIYKKKFGQLLRNIALHQADMQMTNKIKTIPLWRIKRELISPKSSDKTVDPALVSKFFESIVYGYNYPTSLLYTVVKRIKTDSDEENNKFIKMNDIRIGVIKAYINRKSRLSGLKEDFNMALDEMNTNSAYLCGRLFATLERLQLNALGTGLNKTIKDSYFASACSQPATVFPKIMRLSQNHLGKSSAPVFFNKIIGEITDKLSCEFPTSLPLIEQGKFILGYYHQYQHFFVKKEVNQGGNENE